MMWAYDEETGENDWKPVVRLFRNETMSWCTISVAIAGTIESITSTPGHKYYLPENMLNREIGEKQEHASYTGLSEKWVSACNLKVGDKVLLSDGKYGIIQSVKVVELSTPETTYNFEVEDFHTYYVTEKAVLVHNKCGFDKLYDDPGSLVGKSADEVEDILGPTFKRTAYGSRGDGWRFIDKAGNKIAYNTAGGRHGSAYYILQKANMVTRLKVVGIGYNPLNEARTIYYFFNGIIP